MSDPREMRYDRPMACMMADNSFDPSVFARSSCAFGVFDGFHRGHRYLVDRTIETASRTGERSIVITFDIDPDEVFRPHSLGKLMSNDERIATLAASGVDDVVVIPFTRGLYTLSPDEFLASTFSQGAPSHLHVGENIRFGAKATGDALTLVKWGRTRACRVHVHRLLGDRHAPISSTRIRALLQDGEIDAATQLLGHEYHGADPHGASEKRATSEGLVS